MNGCGATAAGASGILGAAGTSNILNGCGATAAGSCWTLTSFRPLFSLKILNCGADDELSSESLLLSFTIGFPFKSKFIKLLFVSLSGPNVNTSFSDLLFSNISLTGVVFISLLFILSISSSVLLTVNLSFIILSNNLFWSCILFNLNKDLACRSDILFSKSASWTSSDNFNNLILFATYDWLFPTFSASCCWVAYPKSIALLYDKASSIADKFFLCKFSIIAISEHSESFKSLIIAGIVSLPAKTFALYRRSPATSSYLSLSGLTIIGSKTPYFFIDSVSSKSSSSENFFLGWNRFGKISLLSKTTTLCFLLISTLPPPYSSNPWYNILGNNSIVFLNFLGNKK